MAFLDLQQTTSVKMMSINGKGDYETCNIFVQNTDSIFNTIFFDVNIFRQINGKKVPTLATRALIPSHS